VPPPPLPDGEFGLIKASREGLAKVTDKAAALKLAAVQRSHASACAAGAFPDFAAALEGWRAANKGAVDAATWAPWGVAVSTQLKAAYTGNKLPTKTQWAAAFSEIADGLEGK